MNKDAQRRIALIIIVAVICSMFGSSIDKENLKENPAISVGKWNQMIAAAFQTEVQKNTNEKQPLTGEYIAETLMDNFEEDTIKILSDEKGYVNGVEFAVANGIISRNQVQSEFSQDAADRALSIAMDLYSSEIMYPEYNETVYRENVVEAFDWDIVSGDEEFSSIVVNTTGEAPKEGEILLLHDEKGIAKARKVVSSQQNDQGGYVLSLARVEQLSEIAEVISFSGVAEFDSPVEQKMSQTAYIPMAHTATAGLPMPTHTSAFIVDGAKNLWEGAKNTWNNIVEGVDDFTDDVFGYNIDNHGGKQTDFTIGLAIEIDDEGKKSIATIVKQDGVETEFGIGEDGELAASISFDNIEVEVEEDEEEEEEESSDVEEEAKARIEGTVSLNDFRVATKGFLVTTDWLDEDNFFDVIVDTDVAFNLAVSGEFEGKYKLSDSIECRIPITAGTVAVELVPYLVINAEGKVSLTWEIEGIKTGMNVSVEDGVKTRFNVKDKKFSAEANIEIQTGVAAEVAISFLEFDLIDPGIEILPLTITGSVLPKNEGFENYPPCMELGIRGIDLSLSVSYGDDSATYHILKALNKNFNPTFTLIDSEETPLFEKKAHIELNEKGKPIKVEECTRVKHDPLGDLVEDAIGDAVDQIEDEATSYFESMIEDMIEDMLFESCGGCY